MFVFGRPSLDRAARSQQARLLRPLQRLDKCPDCINGVPALLGPPGPANQAEWLTLARSSHPIKRAAAPPCIAAAAREPAVLSLRERPISIRLDHGAVPPVQPKCGVLAGKWTKEPAGRTRPFDRSNTVPKSETERARDNSNVLRLLMHVGLRDVVGWYVQFVGCRGDYSSGRLAVSRQDPGPQLAPHWISSGVTPMRVSSAMAGIPMSLPARRGPKTMRASSEILPFERFARKRIVIVAREPATGTTTTPENAHRKRGAFARQSRPDPAAIGLGDALALTLRAAALEAELALVTHGQPHMPDRCPTRSQTFRYCAVLEPERRCLSWLG